jgi:hypothetical protein
MRRNGRSRVSSLAAVLALLTFGLAFAANGAEASSRKSTQRPNTPAQMAVLGAPNYGISSYEVATVTAYDFKPFAQAGNVTGIDSDGNSFIWATAGNNLGFSASVQIPAGVVIDYIALRYCDSTVNSDFRMDLDDIHGDGSNDFIFDLTFPDNPGCGLAIAASPAGYNWDHNSGHSLDFVIFQEGPDVGGQVKFRGAEVWYKRKISPAPGSPTFGDVDPGNIYYQFIEALAASGVTSGCDLVPNYCPDRPITRAEMAVFLAKALGLHFSN